MSTTDSLAPDRVERLLAGAAPEGEREALLAGLVRELRAAPAAQSEQLRARIFDRPPAPERARRRRAWRPALALVALGVLGATGAALYVARDSEQPVAERAPRVGAPTVPTVQTQPSPTTPIDERVEAEKKAYSAQSAVEDERVLRMGGVQFQLDAAPRAQDVEMAIELRLPDADRLSETATDATRIVRELGGRVISSRVDTDGREGSAGLALQLPVGRLEDAVVRISTLGTVTAQDVTTRDLERRIDARTLRIEALERAIRRDEIRLRSGALTPYERLEVELRLEAERARLRQARRVRADLRREAAFAELTLRLHTRAPTAGAEGDNRGLAGAARDGASFLAGAGYVAVFALVVVGPSLFLAFLAWAALRRRRRRADEALLEHPRPAAPPPRAG